MISNEKGWALPLVLLVMVVIFILGSTLWLMSMTNLTHVIREEDRMQAHYYARSGAEMVAAEIGNGINPDNITEGAIVSESITFTDGNNGQEDLSENIKVELYKQNGDIIIRSTGKVLQENSVVSETLELRLIEGNKDNRHWKAVRNE